MSKKKRKKQPTPGWTREERESMKKKAAERLTPLFRRGSQRPVEPIDAEPPAIPHEGEQIDA